MTRQTNVHENKSLLHSCKPMQRIWFNYYRQHSWPLQVC